MTLFDQLVDEALKNQPDLAPLRVVVEKELLHHDILRILSEHHLLTHLTFIGGTCLRSCYGGIRLSENLDFTGGHDFNRTTLSIMGNILVESLQTKYGLSVKVTEPIKDNTNVDTWKIKIETRPAQRHLASQRINIDICVVPSYEKRPMMLLNPYGVEMGTTGLVIQAQSREEIYADKLVAFALRPNRLKYRDLWDMVWLHQQGVHANISLIPNKLNDRHYEIGYFLDLFNERTNLLSENKSISTEFTKEMQRFLPPEQINKNFTKESLWAFTKHLLEDFNQQFKERVFITLID